MNLDQQSEKLATGLFGDEQDALVAQQVANEPTDDLDKDLTVSEPELPIEPTSPTKHLRSRLILSATNWNSAIGSKNNQRLVSDKWIDVAFSEEKQKDMVKHIEHDVANLPITWKPISYFLNEFSSSAEERERLSNQKYVLVLTNGDYIYARIEDGHFVGIYADGDIKIPSDVIVTLRETSVNVNDVNHPDTFHPTEYVVKASTGVNLKRHAQHANKLEREWKNKKNKRRAAGKAGRKANAARRK